jgi:aerobic-type carbon monoxide dehydrogenase small subunit (CoxS/CutS family)
VALSLSVNGSQHSLDVPADEKLLFVLRDQLKLTGSKYGCGEGECGACTILMDGKPVRSCRVPVGSAAGKRITTIEGLEVDGRLHPVQQAFLEAEAFQCGYCTPGMIMSAVSLLRGTKHPSEGEIVRSMNGNICRCGTYSRIIAAIRSAAGKSKS